MTEQELAWEEAAAKKMVSDIDKVSSGKKFKACINADAFGSLDDDCERVAQSIAGDWYSLFDGDGGDDLPFNKTTEFHLKYADKPMTASQLFTGLVNATASKKFQPKYFETQRTQPFVNILLLLAFAHLRKMVSDNRRLMLWCEANFDDRNAVRVDDVLFGRSDACIRFSDQSLFTRESNDSRAGYDSFDRANAVSTVECKRTLSKPTKRQHQHDDDDVDQQHEVDEAMCEAALLGCERDGLFVSGQHVRQQMRVHDAIITDGVTFYRVRVWWEVISSAAVWKRQVIVSELTSLRPTGDATAPSHSQLLAVARLLVGSVHDGLKCEFKPTTCLQEQSWPDGSHLKLLECFSGDSTRVITKWQFVPEGNTDGTFKFVSKSLSSKTGNLDTAKRFDTEVKAMKLLFDNDVDARYLALATPFTTLNLPIRDSDRILVFLDAGEPLSAKYVGGKRGQHLASTFNRCIVEGALPALHRAKLVHNDIHGGNVLLDESEDIMRLIDLESVTLIDASLKGIPIMDRPWERPIKAEFANDNRRAADLQAFLEDEAFHCFQQFEMFMKKRRK